MNESFTIKFNFALDDSDVIISVIANVDPHHSELYYVVDDFHLTSTAPTNNDLSVIPVQEIKQIRKDSSPVWVHKDSGRESMLSAAIGKAIEDVLKNNRY